MIRPSTFYPLLLLLFNFLFHSFRG
jgi:hypothetical protein